MASPTIRLPLKCFIASAFGRTDVDAIYDKVVSPVLKRLLIEPRRVDREVHNDAIDKKIFELIDDSDFCITDLTYARPSAYYEAGYASGKGKPVIYIVKRDHFRPKPEDVLGNEKVHFDLQMKHIIGWTGPENEFVAQLTRQVEHVTLPLIAKRRVELEAATHAAEFNQMSVVQRVDILKEACIREAKRAGLKAHYSESNRTSGKELDFFYILQGKVLQSVRFFSAEKQTKTDLKLYSRPMFGSEAIDIAHKKILRHQILTTLSGVSIPTLSSALSHWVPVSDKTFTFRREDPDHPYAEVIWVLDKVLSVKQFVDRLRPILEGIVSGVPQPTRPVPVAALKLSPPRRLQ